ncbi:MAG: hypothetical protein ACR2LK_01530 [Solirubrobacteraceae bacterium]
MSAKRLNYWDYERDATLTCPSCGWTGRGADNEDYFEELLDVRCAECDSKLLIVAFPTIEETRAAVVAGNARAQAELPNADARDSFLERAQQLELKEAAQLPDLDGKANVSRVERGDDLRVSTLQRF